MPVATVLAETHRYDLKTCPEGYVIVRRMTYGEELARSGMATKFTVGGGGANTKKEDFKGEIDINTEEVALWDFANLIVEHNLTDDKEQPLNFKNRAHVRALQRDVGKEIGDCIDEWNSQIDSEETKNS